MASVLGDLILRVKGDASGATDAMGEAKGGIGGLIDPATAAKGALMGIGAGLKLAGERMVPFNQAISRTAQITGESKDELHDMASELTDVTFPLEDVTRGMEMLAERGVTSRQEMERLLPTIDDMADALDMDYAQALEKADTFMRANGQSMEEFDDASAEMLFTIETLTDDGMNALTRAVRQSDESLEDLGMSGDELATVMVGLSRNTVNSREASQELREALDEAGGDADKFRELIEGTTGSLDQYDEDVNRVSGSMDEMAEINNENITLMDRLKQRADELMFAFSDELQAVRDWGMAFSAMVPVFSKLIPLVKGLATAKFTMLIPAIKATIAAALPILGPVGIIMAIVGLIWILREDIFEVFSFIAQFVPTSIQDVIDIFEFWREKTGEIQDWIFDKIESIWYAVTDFLQAQMQKVYDVTIQPFIDVYNFITGKMEEVREFFENFSLIELGKDIIWGLIDGIKDAAAGIKDTVFGVGERIKDGIASALGIDSPAKEMITVGNETIEGLKKGIEDKAQEVRKTMNDKIGKAIKEGVTGATEEAINSFGRFIDKLDDVEERALDLQPVFSGLTAEVMSLNSELSNLQVQAQTAQGTSQNITNFNQNAPMMQTGDLNMQSRSDIEFMASEIERLKRKNERRVGS